MGEKKNPNLDPNEDLISKYASSIQKSLSQLRQLLSNEDLKIDYAPVRADLQTLVFFTLNNLSKWDSRRICLNFELPFSPNLSKKVIINEIIKKGCTIKVSSIDALLYGSEKVDIHSVLLGLEQICKQLGLYLTVDVYEKIKDTIGTIYFKCKECSNKYILLHEGYRWRDKRPQNEIRLVVTQSKVTIGSKK